MPNIDFEIRQIEGGNTPQAVIARVRATGEEMRGFARALASAAVHEGERVARLRAPRGRELREAGHRIEDSIQTSEVRYAPGGAGGGGFYEADLFADGFIAPHLKYVFSGTMGEGSGRIEPHNAIKPGKGNLSGVLAIEKEGEGVHFRRWVRGQKPQQEWWDLGREAVERTLEVGIQQMDFTKYHD